MPKTSDIYCPVSYQPHLAVELHRFSVICIQNIKFSGSTASSSWSSTTHNNGNKFRPWAARAGHEQDVRNGRQATVATRHTTKIAARVGHDQDAIESRPRARHTLGRRRQEKAELNMIICRDLPLGPCHEYILDDTWSSRLHPDVQDPIRINLWLQ